MHPDPDRRARFEALWDAHYRAVLAYATRRTTPDEARDIAADAFTAAWRRLDQAPEDPRLWLLGLARGALANSRRSDRRREALNERVAANLAPPPSGEEDHGLADALARMGERDVEALILVAWEGLSNTEAARVVGCSTAAFAVRLHRARRRLEQLMARPAAAVVTPEEPA